MNRQLLLARPLRTDIGLAVEWPPPALLAPLSTLLVPLLARLSILLVLAGFAALLLSALPVWAVLSA